jgi:hypothetical protein
MLKGHLSPDCSKKNTIKKKDWYIRKAEQQMQVQQENEDEAEENEANADDASSTSPPRVNWSGLLIAESVDETSHYYAGNKEMGSRLKNWITLDNGSTLSLFFFQSGLSGRRLNNKQDSCIGDERRSHKK